jgi:hypothetical protein
MGKKFDWSVKLPPLHEHAAILVIWLATIHHIVWGLLLLGWNGQIQATPIAMVRNLLPSHTVALGLFIASAFAMAGLEQMNKADGSLMKRIAYMLPQQAVLMLSAWSAFVAILNGHYADLEIRPRAFIAADQSIHVLLAMFHTFAIVVVAEVRHYATER